MKKRLFSIFIITGILLSMLSTFYSYADTTLRVGYCDYSGFIQKNENGFTGYAYDYLMRISEQTGFKYEFVYDTYQNNLAGLENGAIDLFCGGNLSMQKQKEAAVQDEDGDYVNVLQNVFAFSAAPLGTESSVIYTSKDNSNLYYEDYAGLEGKKIGFIKGTYQSGHFNSIAKDLGFSFRQFDYNTIEELVSDLNKKSLDAIVVSSLASIRDLKTIAKIGSQPFYFMAVSENSGIISQIDSATVAVKNLYPILETELAETYYKNENNSFNITRAEAEFINSSPEITIGTDESNAPVSGICKSIIAKLSEISGLKLKAASGGESAQLPVKIISCSDYTTHESEAAISDKIFDDEIIMVSKLGNAISKENTMKIALPHIYTGGEHILKESFANSTFVTYPTYEECLNSLRKGQADIVITDKLIAQAILKRPVYEELSVVEGFSAPQNFCIAVSENDMLLSILNKSIKMLDNESINNIVMENTSGKIGGFNFSDFIYQYKFALIAVAVLILLCIFMLIYTVIIKKRTNNQLKKRDIQLAEAIAQAERANKARGDFLSRVSAEIKAPVDEIINLAGKKNPDVKSIAFTAKSILNMISSALDLSAIETDRLRIVNEKFNIKELLTPLCNMYYKKCTDKGIRFDLILSSVNQEKLVGDITRVNQILSNLLSNAVKFTEQGGSIKFLIKQTETTDNKVFFKFSIIDTGTGMSEDMRKRLFKPFEQENENSIGGGLGLSITKNLADMMGGSIDVVSEKDIGSTFTVEIPFDIAEISADQTNLDLSGVNALIIDESETCEYMNEVLSNMSITSIGTQSGQLAADKLTKAYQETNGFDLCIINAQLPNIDIISLVRQIRKSFDSDTLPIIVTGYDLSEIENEAKIAGADLFAEKPLLHTDVYGLIMSVTGGRLIQINSDDSEWDFSGRHVLLCEDNSLNAVIMEKMLSKTGIKTDRVKDGKSAVEAVISSPEGEYDAVLLDTITPELDGFTAAREIRASKMPGSDKLPIIAMTANAFSEDVANAFSCGMNDYIAKPIDAQALYKVLYRRFK